MVSTMLTTYSSPLKWRDWDDCLANHPDRRFAANITNGIREGFQIGYDYRSQSSVRRQPATCTLQPTTQK